MGLRSLGYEGHGEFKGGYGRPPQPLGNNGAMCDVHLIETCREHRSRAQGLRCSYCASAIHGDYVHVAGHLDDGSPGLYRFVYHPDCAWDVEHYDEAIEASEGCFDYGQPLSAVPPASQPNCAFTT